jgi:hypothetical protein
VYTVNFPGWIWWNWAWAAAIVVIVLLGVFVLPWFFFLMNLQSTLSRVSERNRAMPPSHVWLNFIPVFFLGWFIYTVAKIRDSIRAEYQSRGWAPEGDFGYNVGLASGILAIVSFVLGWVPVVGWGVPVAALVCWIVYWLKINELKNRLGEPGTWQGTAAPYGYPGPAVPPAGYGAPPYQAVSPRPPAATAAPAAPGSPAAPAPPAAGSAGQAPGEADRSADEGAANQCAGCGTRFDPGDRFCRTCGLPLPQARR